MKTKNNGRKSIKMKRILTVLMAMMIAVMGLSGFAIADDPPMAVDLSCNDTQKCIPPGGTAEYTITVKNTGNMLDTVNLTLSPWPSPPCGWPYGLNKDNVTLSPAESAEVLLHVSDLFHSPGESWAVTVTGTSQGDPAKKDSITTITTIEQPSVEVPAITPLSFLLALLSLLGLGAVAMRGMYRR
jgi:hypothetical protein